MLNLGKFEFVSLPLCKWSQRHKQRRKIFDRKGAYFLKRYLYLLSKEKEHFFKKKNKTLFLE